MSLPSLYIKLIGLPSIEFHHAEGHTVHVAISHEKRHELLLFLALRDEAFDSFMARELLRQSDRKSVV